MRRARTCPRGRERRGGAAAELALLLPPLCFACIATIDFGRGFSNSMAVAECARSGAVHASLTPADEPINVGEVQAAALAAAPLLSPPPTIVVTPGSEIDGAYVEVQATHTFHLLAPYPGIPSETTIVRTVRMRRTPS